MKSVTLEKQLADLCIKHKKIIAMAESCTGGSISAKITKIPNASHFFYGSLVTYSIAAKHKLLQIPLAFIEQHGVISEPIAKVMAQNTLKLYDTDYALAITGLAGPASDEKNTPIGTVYIALANKNFTVAKQKIFTGNREEIIDQATDFCIKELLKFIENNT